MKKSSRIERALYTTMILGFSGIVYFGVVRPSMHSKDYPKSVAVHRDVQGAISNLEKSKDLFEQAGVYNVDDVITNL